MGNVAIIYIIGISTTATQPLHGVAVNVWGSKPTKSLER